MPADYLADKLIFRYLDTNGDGTGTKNANGDYSGAADEFFITADSPCEIHRMVIEIEDTSGFAAAEYGNLGTNLTNGVKVSVDDHLGNELVDLVDGLNVTTNAEWARLCYDADLKTWGAGNEFLMVRWTFARSGQPITLTDGDKLIVTLNDNLSGLVSHYFMVQGYYL